jgi:hypothetical protein
MKIIMKWKIILSCIIVLVFLLGLIFWQPQSDPLAEDTFQSYVDFENLLLSEELILEEEDIDGLLKEYVGEGKDLGNIYIKNIDADIKDGDFNLQSSITYWNIPLSLSLKGQISSEESFIVYDLKKVYLGKIPIPKVFLLRTIEKQMNSQVTIEDEKIKVDKKLLPIRISFLEVKEGVLMIKFDKEDLNRWLLSQMQSKVKEKIKETIDNSIDGLDKIKDKLSEENQKDLVQKIKDSILDFVENPGFHTQEEIEEIKILYNSLTLQEKQELLEAIIPQVDTQTLFNIKEKFGF